MNYIDKDLKFLILSHPVDDDDGCDNDAKQIKSCIILMML